MPGLEPPEPQRCQLVTYIQSLGPAEAAENKTPAKPYDAFGNLIHSTGTTPNLYLYSGEQFDPDLNLYYNRARYLNVSTGRFWTMDTFEGDLESPSSLHKYLYANGDPTNVVDPSGHDGASLSVPNASTHFNRHAATGLKSITCGPQNFTDFNKSRNLLCKHEVAGSIPVTSTNLFRVQPGHMGDTTYLRHG